MATEPLGRIATYTPRIVWGSGTSVDTSEYDDVSRYYLNSPGFVIDGIGRDQAAAYAPPKSPAFDLTLSNHDQRFSPGGVLQNYLGRGPAVTLDVEYGTDVLVDADDVTVDSLDHMVDGRASAAWFTGVASQMQQSIDRRGPATVAVSALGTMASLLVDKRPVTTLYESITTDEAVTAILDAVGWDADLREISSGSTTLLYWWLNGQTTALDAINALLAAEGAGSCAYEDGAGVFHFEGRAFRETNRRSSEVQWTFFDGATSSNAIVDDETVTVDATDVLVDGPLPHPLYHIVPAQYTSNPDEVVKSVAATVNTRVASSVQKIGEFGTALTLTSNQVYDWVLTTQDPFKSAVTPADATDYTVSVGSLASVALLSTSGQSVTVRWTAGGSGATILGVTSNGPQLRAVNLPVVSSQVVTSTTDTSTTAPRYQPQDPLVLDAWPEVEPTQALDLVNSYALRYRRERRKIHFSVRNVDATHMHTILTMQISDRIRFVHTYAFLNIEAWVEQLGYVVAPGGGTVTLNVGCEQVFDLGGGAFDSAQFDIDVFGLG